MEYSRIAILKALFTYFMIRDYPRSKMIFRSQISPRTRTIFRNKISPRSKIKFKNQVLSGVSFWMGEFKINLCL